MLITHDMGVVATVCSKVIIMYGGLVMESGTVEEVFYENNYKVKGCVYPVLPQEQLNWLREEGERLQSIPGLPPSLIDPPKGCPFAERCEYATERCKNEKPEYTEFTETHRAMCFLNE